MRASASFLTIADAAGAHHQGHKHLARLFASSINGDKLLPNQAVPLFPSLSLEFFLSGSSSSLSSLCSTGRHGCNISTPPWPRLLCSGRRRRNATIEPRPSPMVPIVDDPKRA